MSQPEETLISRKHHPRARDKKFLIANLDATIAGFGDGHVFRDDSTDEFWFKDLEENNEESTKSGATMAKGIVQKYAPEGLEEPFQQLYSILFPALFRGPSKTNRVRNEPETSQKISNTNYPVSASSAAILMGVKGSGKTLLLERVLMACREQLQPFCSDGRRLYRMVEINGIVCRGENVGTVVYEMIRQLSGIAYRSMRRNKKLKGPQGVNGNRTNAPVVPASEMDGIGGEKNNKRSVDQTVSNTFEEEIHDQNNKYRGEDGNNLRARKRLRRLRKQQKIDKHILRLRKATYNSNLALFESILKLAATDEVPIILTLDELDSFTDKEERQTLLYHFLDRVATPGFNLILIGMTSSFSSLTLLEKRVRSRAEGTAKIIYLRTPPTYEGLLKLVESKLKGCFLCRDIMKRLTHPTEIEAIGREIVAKNTENETLDEISKLSIAMEREFRFGKDVRWFGRVISTSLSLYRHDFLMSIANESSFTEDAPLEFTTSYLWNAMAMLGGSIFDCIVASRQPDLCTIGDVAVSSRLQSLLDLSTPQVALLLSARRILKREQHREDVVFAPLTIERMLKEYESYRRGSISKGNSKLLKRAAHQLLQQGLLIPSMDHSGGGPLQYDVSKSYRDLDQYTLSRLPLHLPYDIDREVGKALEDNLLECSTALKEWGKSISKK